MAEDRFDAAVIGAGVVGAAAARALALAGARVVVLEKAADILDGASKANSAILHTGFDAPPGSIESACLAEGYAEYRRIHARLGLPLLESGALVLAWTEEEEARLPALIEQAQLNGVSDVEPLGAAALRACEPGLGPGLRAGFRVPGEHLVDPWSAPLAYLHQAAAHGAVIRRACEVQGGTWDGALWRLETGGDPVQARVVVNAAGLWGDVVDERLLGRRRFAIRPRKGQFVVYDKTAFGLTRHILLPVPSATTKGVVVCRTVWGNLLVGPTAEDQDDRTTAVLDPAVLEALRRRGEAILPALSGHEPTAAYAGLRPATEDKDYRIGHDPDRAYVTLGGIRSTGLSAALGLAARLVRMLEGQGATQGWIPPADPVWPVLPNLAETAPRDWQRPGHGGIVCHCEMVTRREILAALEGSLGARTLGGLKRRTRVTMGRCQGFYCTPALARLTAGRLDPPLAEPLEADGAR
ncbi:NAD(P)/FAD-dependent oxidoreductase [Rubellimicrobium sp. CFH 75288]|uniref:NAD(P)/FAD-dependent oxidoreductase n=1 Tax=Rubellimicrobium sp. CFH 75288 TaxID=2697034 RepID=UPI001412FB07|nr:NAD(P)/FAD-dependent oxidoreductase [Rubellimicrobium sp. CFH 75288]NAZ37550.1 FAD-dependent oxidoreductase [Rubellimicrobium sp. CFH 75288]